MNAVLGLERGTARRDLALAGAYLTGGLVLFSLGSYHQMSPAPWPGQPAGLFLGTLAGAVVAIALRRVATLASVLLGTAAVGVDLALGASLATILAFTQVLFDACVFGSPRMWRWLLRITCGGVGLALLAGVVAAGSWQGAQFAVLMTLIGVLPVVGGIGVRQYRDQAEAERARAEAERTRAEQTARLAELDRRQAVTAERTRMARELHDVIANHLSAVAIHATAVLSVPGLDRRQVDQALQVIRENSVQGLAEMRQMVGLLRDPEQSPPADRHPPAPEVAAAGGGARASDGADDTGALRVRLAEVDRLVEQTRRAGLEVRLRTTGPARPLPVSVDLAAYRIVQESLTNALKHGVGPVAVEIDYGPDRISVRVENPVPEYAFAAALAGGPTEPDRLTAYLPGAGAGLIGMRERAALLGGRFDAGPHRQRWRVRAELPTLREAASGRESEPKGPVS